MDLDGAMQALEAAEKGVPGCKIAFNPRIMVSLAALADALASVRAYVNEASSAQKNMQDPLYDQQYAPSCSDCHVHLCRRPHDSLYMYIYIYPI